LLLGELEAARAEVARLRRAFDETVASLEALQRGRAEDEVRRSEAMLMAFTDASPDLMFIKDRDGRCLFANPASLRALGRAREDVVGKTDHEVIQDAAMEAVVRENDRLVMETGGAQAVEECIPTPAGKRWFLTSKAPLRDRDGRVIGVVGVSRDITDRRNEEARAARQDRLATIGMAAAGVGHEINNPLTYVLSNIESLTHELPRLLGAATAGDTARSAGRSEADDAALRQEVLQSATEALEGIHRIRDITKRLAALSRVEQVEHTSADLNRALEAAAGMANHEIRFRATLTKQLGDMPPVWATEGKLTQVFLNLLLNAAHSIDEGDALAHRVTLRTWAHGADVLVEVADTGRGIPPENLERIFEPFFTTKPSGMGSGLGLAICRSIVAELGGDISVTSRVGEGTRVVVRLPASVASRGTPPGPPREADAPAPLRAPRGRLLVVDDEVALTRSLARTLGSHHDVVVANSGREARTLLEGDRAFDVVLCDLMMPDVDGVELHSWLAHVDPALASRVVFMSGGAFIPRVADYVARTGTLRIDKPFDTAQLRGLVAGLVLAARR